jgi:phage tail tape-measure protein
MASPIEEFVAILGWKMEGEDNLRRFQRGIDETAKKIAVFAAGIAVAATGALAALSKSVISTSAEFESFHATLETITGSAAAADKAMDWISKFAQTTPYDVAEVTDAFVKLKAYGIDPIANDALRTLGDAASAMNKPLNQAVEALADATTFEFERLKEFGLTTKQAGDQVVFSWNANGKQMSKTIKKNSEDVRRFVLEQLGGRFSGAMIRQSKTWTGMISNLGDSWTNFQLRIGRSGFFDAVKAKLGNLLDYIGRLDADGTLDRWANNIGSAFTTVVDQVTRIGNNFANFAEIIQKNAPAWDTIKAFLIALGIRLFPVAALLSVAALAIEDFLTYLNRGDSVIGKFIDALSGFLGADPQKVAEVLGALAKSGMGMAAAAFGVSLFAGALRSLGSALGILGSSTAVTGAATVRGLGLVGSVAVGAGGVWALTELLQKGKEQINSDPAKAAQSTPGANSARVKARGEALRSWWSGLFGDGTPPPETMAQRLSNAQGNWANMNGARQASSTPGPVTDNRNQSVTVQVGGVTVQGVQNVTAAVGGAVGNAVGQGAARASRFEKDDAF